MKHQGGCHCGRVRFEVEAPEDIAAYECNCSICIKTGYWHLIVPASGFRLLAGREDLTTYTFNTGIAQHLFCRVCGIKSFYVPRSNPDGFSVNVRCLDKTTVRSISLQPFNGEDWESDGAKLAHLSQPADTRK